MLGNWQAQTTGKTCLPFPYSCLSRLTSHLSFSKTFLEGILEVPCVGILIREIVNHPSQAGDCVLFFNRDEAHSNHTPATSISWNPHLRVACGLRRAPNLSVLFRTCSSAGKAASAAIAMAALG